MDYVSLAVRTENKDFDGIRSRSTDGVIRLLHGSMGIATEVAEIFETSNKDHLKEELGDLMWYVALICYELELDLPAIEKVAPTESNHKRVLILDSDLVTVSGTMLDILKKHLFYGKPLNSEAMSNEIRKMVEIVTELCAYYQIDYQDMKERNIAKLQARYPNKFTEADAIKRDLDKEKKALGG